MSSLPSLLPLIDDIAAFMSACLIILEANIRSILADEDRVLLSTLAGISYDVVLNGQIAGFSVDLEAASLRIFSAVVLNGIFDKRISMAGPSFIQPPEVDPVLAIFIDPVVFKKIIGILIPD